MGIKMGRGMEVGLGIENLHPLPFSDLTCKSKIRELQSNQVRRTPQDHIKFLIILILNWLVVSSRTQ